MKKPLLFLPILFLFLSISSNSNAQTETIDAGRMNEVFRKTVLVTGATDPWELTMGPDGFLWYTEAKGYRVRRMTATGGSLATVLDLSQASTFTPASWKKQYSGNGPQGGMMGMAFHPQFGLGANDSPFVYLAYIRSYHGTPANNPVTGEAVNGAVYTTYLTKWRWNGTNLNNPVMICDTIRGSNDHNSGRMIIAPDATEGGQYFLYYAVGDMGAGQFDNVGRVIKAQWDNSYEGKILRFKLHGQGGTWIPSTNPQGTASAVYAKGIRNNQGFAYDPDNNKLYGTSHGPFSDDELNIIKKGKNYGHPLVIGYRNDNNYQNSKAATPPSILPLITNENTNATNIGLSVYEDPMFSAYPSTQSEINHLYNDNPPNGDWPSEGWTGMGLFTGSKIPGWKKSLLIGSLKWGRVLRFKLDPVADTVVDIGGQDTISYFGGKNRFRDIAIDNNDPNVFYVSMDNSTTSSGPSEANPIVQDCFGCIHRYQFLGYFDNAGASTIRNFVPIAPATAFSCETENSVIINNASPTFNSTTGLWVPITDNNSNIVAEIRGNGQTLNNVTTSVYRHGGATVRKDGGNRRFLNRNLQISVQNQPVGANTVKVRFYITKAEVDSLVNSGAITNFSQIGLFKSSNSCASNVPSAAARVNGTSIVAFGTQGYVLTADINSFSSFYFANNSLTTLPADLLAFAAELTPSNTVKVDWKTGTETNVKNYDVERSLDGVNWEIIGTVNAYNNGNAENSYTFTDVNAGRQPSMTLYYRLSINDLDNTSKNSKVVTVTLSNIAGRVFATPNPTMDVTRLTINAYSNDKGQWSIIDNSGRVVMQSAMQLRTGNNTVTIDIKKLAAGMYYLDVKGGGITTRVKLQKL